MNRSVEAISVNLKEAREKRGLSLDQLSELTGVSKSMLRQIEMGKSSPTISTIWKIANGLHLSFTALLRKPEIRAEVKSFKTGSILTAEEGKCRLYPLVPFDPHQSFETYYFEIDPGTVYSGEPHQGQIYEYVFVTRGILEITIEDKSFTIHENEFLKFEANYQHKYRCIGDTMAAAIMQLGYTL
jgi:XRE family transcriptional regulator, regulator of sulfur utilization